MDFCLHISEDELHM